MKHASWQPCQALQSCEPLTAQTEWALCNWPAEGMAPVMSLLIYMTWIDHAIEADAQPAWPLLDVLAGRVNPWIMMNYAMTM